jgi:hypothetical protein
MQPTSNVQRSTYLMQRLATLSSGRYPASWGALYASETLRSPMLNTTPDDARVFGLGTDAAAPRISTDELGMIGALKRIATRTPDAFSAEQMRRVANTSLSLLAGRMTEWQKQVVVASGGTVSSVHAAYPGLGRALTI